MAAKQLPDISNKIFVLPVIPLLGYGKIVGEVSDVSLWKEAVVISYYYYNRRWKMKINNRREFLKLGAAGLAMGLPTLSFAAGFPSRTMEVYIPTRAGGGADRNFRSFASVWKNHLGGEFEPAFYPGAAGRVGYETYMGKASDDCHDLIFGNMGPEVLNWVVKPPASFSTDDYFYFLMVDADPGSVFISDKSPMKSLEDVIAEGKKRTLTIATSRLAHPASLGMLVLANKTGMKVNLVPIRAVCSSMPSLRAVRPMP